MSNVIEKQDRHHVLHSMSRSLGAAILAKMVDEISGADASRLKWHEENVYRLETQLRSLAMIYQAFKDIEERSD